MTELASQFDLKLLTASKDVGLRRWRSYAASLGGGAQLFHKFEDLIDDLNKAAQSHNTTIVVHDTSIPLSAEQQQQLQRLGRIFRVGPEQLATPETTADVGTNSVFECTLATFLDSMIIRTCMAHICKPAAPDITVLNLLRWGHIGTDWHCPGSETTAPQHNEQPSDAALSFMRKLHLTGENRRLIEMFSHFLSTNMQTIPLSGLRVEQANFRADGLITLAAVTCEMVGSTRRQPETPESLDKITPLIKHLGTELRGRGFPHVLINRLGPHRLEIAVAAAANANTSAASSDGKCILLVLTQKPIAAGDTQELPKLDQVG